MTTVAANSMPVFQNGERGDSRRPPPRSLHREFQRCLLQPVALRLLFLCALVPDIEPPVARTVMILWRHLDRPAGQAAHVYFERLDDLVELLTRARPSAGLERAFDKFAECPSSEMHARERLGRAVFLLRRRDLRDHRIVVVDRAV